MKKVISLVLAAMVTGGLVAGCGSSDANNGENNSSTGNNENSSESNGEDEGDNDEASKEPVTLYITAGKTGTLNPHLISNTEEGAAIAKIYGNLFEIVVNEAGDNYELIANHAADLPEMSEDGLTWTVEIRDGVKFEDGTPITADTYEYTYKTMLDPVLKNSKATTFFGDIEFKNAKAYFNGECEWEEVGIKADGNKLIFELAYPVPAMDFQMLFTGGGSTSPLHQELYESCYNEDRTENSYGTSVETIMSSGPYKLTTWVRDQHKVYEKNEDYPLAHLYTPDIIDTRVVEESSTELTLFENGDIDFAEVSGANYDKYQEDPRVVLSESEMINNMFINSTSETNPILGDVNFRKALFYAMDRETIAEDIYKTSYPAPYFVSSFKFAQEGLPYRETEAAQSVLPENNGYDPELAKDHFDKAYEANGNKKVEVELMYFDTAENMKKMAELLESEYENLFGADKIDVQLVATPWQASYDNLRSGNFDLGFGGFSGGTFNPWASMKVYTSDFQGKLERFYNEEFDQLYYDTVKGDLIFEDEARIEALARMEELLYEHMPFVPIHQSRTAYIFSDRVTLKTGGKYLPVVGFGELQAEIAPK